RTDVRVAVVTVHAPGLQHAIRVSVFAGAADVIHDFVAPVLADGLSNPPGDVIQRFVPWHLLPLPAAAIAGALQRIENAIGVVELIRCDDPLGAGPAAAARVERVALDFAHGEIVFVD